MSILVFGANGQVGQALLQALRPSAPVVAATRSGLLADGQACERADFDAPAELTALLDRLRPRRVVNAAAYTAVDRAESEPEAAFRANARAPGVIAAWCAEHDAELVHYSTDYVFAGDRAQPYPPDAATAPLGVYGASKLAGEQAVRAAGGRALILRTAWVYAAHGHNFLRTMLRLAGERDCLRVVADQVGAPTSARLIAEVTAHILRQGVVDPGIHHLTAGGQTSWHGFAEEIFARARAHGLLARVPEVVPIGSADYPTPARRPAYSCLDTRALQARYGVALPDWREGVDQTVRALAAAGPAASA